MLTVQLQKRFPGRDFALDLTFTLSPGITILFGPSGAGKTTLLDCIAGLTIPDSGKIAIGDRVLFDSTNRRISRHSTANSATCCRISRSFRTSR